MIFKIKFWSLLFILVILQRNLAFTQHAMEKQILWTADWSPDDRLIAIGGNTDTLHIYSSKDLLVFKSYPVKNTITRVKWHPTKNVVAVATQTPGNSVFILNPETDESIALEGISSEGARGIDWNHSGELLAVADNNGQITIFDTAGRLVHSIKPKNAKSLTSIDWHPKKNSLITVGDKIRIYDVDGMMVKQITHRKEDVLILSVAWHKSGDFFVTGDYGDHQKGYKPMLQYRTANGDLLKSVSLSKGEYRNISWNTAGNRLASASDALRIWSKKGKLIYQGFSEDYLWGLSWNRKGDRLVTSSTRQKIIIWDHRARRKLTRE